MTHAEVLTAIDKDDRLKAKVIDALVADKNFIDAITRSVFTNPAQSVGLNAPGTITEFFVNNRFKNIRQTD